MTPQQIEAAAATLADARRQGRWLLGLPQDQAPSTLAEGYAIQDAFRRCWVGGGVSGWKVGATAKAIMDRFGVSQPFTGPMFAADVTASPAVLPASRHPHLCVEAEFAFRMAQPLAPRPVAYARVEVVAAIGAVLPGFEVIGPRFTSLMLGSVASAVADCSLNQGMVLGPATTQWRGLDLPRHAVRFLVDGVLTAEGSGAAVMGDPVGVMVWTANHLSARGITLEAGQIVTTGATCGLLFLEPGQRGCADFGALGQIEISFSGPRADVAITRP